MGGEADIVRGRGTTTLATPRWMLCLIRLSEEVPVPSLGHPHVDDYVDDYLRFVTSRAWPNTLLAAAFDLKVFFTVIGEQPAAVTPDVLAFLNQQRSPRRGAGVVRLEGGEAGLLARTLKRRLTSVPGLSAYLIARGDSGITGSPSAARAGDPALLATRARGAADPNARGRYRAS